MGALYKGFIVTAIASLLILYPVTDSIVGLTETYSNNKKTYGLDGRAYILNKLKDNGFSIFESQCDHFCTKEK